jgi:hypothetical protein
MAHPLTKTLRVTFPSLTLHQTLHGYADGHRLLMASRAIPERAARIMLTQSDLSGAIPSKGFETYFTAYPLTELDAYVIARSWYAPEMPRPGCVWTHSLLVTMDDLQGIQSLTDLLPLFRRPDPKRPEGYDHVVQVGHKELAFASAAGVPRSEAWWWMDAFFSEPVQPIVAAAIRPNEFDEQVFALWDMLWPRARGTMTFSTGSLAPRKFEGRYFDIQVGSQTMVREMSRVTVVRAYSTADSVVDSDEVWAELLSILGDHQTWTRFAAFLNEVTDDSFRRSEMRPLFLLFRLADRARNSREEYLGLLQGVAGAYPEPQSAEKLKAWCLELGGNDEDSELWLFQELLSAPFASAYTSPSVALSDRANRVFQRAPHIASELLSRLLRRDLSLFGETIARAFIATWPEQETVEFLRTHTRFLSTFLRLRPSLAESHRLWDYFRFHSTEILDVASASSLDQGAAARILDAMVEASVDFDAGRFVDRFSVAGVAAVFERFGGRTWDYHNRWLEAVSARPHLVIEFLLQSTDLGPHAIAGVAVTLSPSQLDPSLFPAPKWVDALDRSVSTRGELPQPQLDVSAFTFAIAIQSAKSIPAALCFSCFERLHIAEENDPHIPNRTWSILEPLVPYLSNMRWWDKCERLRRAVIHISVRDGWAIDVFRPLAERAAVFTQLIESAKALGEDGKLFLRRLDDHITSGFPWIRTDVEESVSPAKKTVRRR